MRQLALTIILTLANLSPTAAEPLWQPEGGGTGISAQTRVVGDIQTFPDGAGGLRVRGWVVDGFSATRPDRVQIDDLAGKPLGDVASGSFVRRRDVETRFGSSAFSLSGFELSIAHPPSTLLVRAHLGQMGWWQTMIETSLPLQARLTRLECVGSAAVEVEVASADPFPVRDALAELQVGQLVSSLSRYPDSGDTHTLIFTLTRDELTSVSSDDQAIVRYNPSNGHDAWLIGSIEPSTAQGCEADDSELNTVP